MARLAKKTLKGISLRGNVYHARLTIPKNARDAIGLVEFTQSLETSDLRVAKTRGETFIRDWKHQITKALGKLSPMSEALLWKEELNKAKQDYVPRNSGDYSPVLDALHDKIESIATAENLERAKTFSDIVEGISIPSDSFVEAYLATRTVNSRSNQQEKTRIGYGTEAFPKFPINKQQVNRWAATLLQKYAHGTAKSIINNNAQYYQYLLDMGHVDADLTNPFKDVRLSNGGGRKNGSNSKRIPWTANQVTDLINACGAKGDVELLYITLLAAHTGARVEELATLLVSSIHLNVTIPYFKITKSKTNAGLRNVPVHPYIYPLLEQMVNQSTNEFLFSNLKMTAHQERSSAISKRFGRLKTTLGYGANQVFHSFRHTATTMLEQAGVRENIVMDIMGHEKPNLTFGHYSEGTSMEQRYEAICKSIDFSFHNIPVSELIG
jgi:integrase